MLHRFAATSPAALSVAVLVVAGSVVQLPGGSPAVRVVPTPATAGQAVSAIGSGFCGSAGCGPVRITIGGQQVGTGEVSSGGAFDVDFRAPTIPNQYTVVAEQPGSPGTQASTGLLVAASNPAPSGTTTTTGGDGTGTTTRPPTTATTGDDGPTTSTETTAASTTSTKSDGSADDLATSKDSDDEESSALPWVLGAAMLAAAIGAGAWLWRRRHRPVT